MSLKSFAFPVSSFLPCWMADAAIESPASDASRRGLQFSVDPQWQPAPWLSHSDPRCSRRSPRAPHPPSCTGRSPIEGSEIASEPQPAYCGIVRNDAEYPPITRIERGMVHLSYGINSRPLPARAISTIFNCESLSSPFRRHPVPVLRCGVAHTGAGPVWKAVRSAGQAIHLTKSVD